MMLAIRFSFRLPDGRIVSGPVQGAGGFIRSLEYLRAQQQNLRDGYPLPIYEPQPGCVAVYPQFSVMDNGPVEIVDLREAEIVGET